jgi:hypothetical protein
MNLTLWCWELATTDLILDWGASKNSWPTLSSHFQHLAPDWKPAQDQHTGENRTLNGLRSLKPRDGMINWNFQWFSCLWHQYLGSSNSEPCSWQPLSHRFSWDHRRRVQKTFPVNIKSAADASTQSMWLTDDFDVEQFPKWLPSEKLMQSSD